MIKEIEFALEEWKLARNNTIELIRDLNDEGLHIELPRPYLDTFGKHFQEMIDVERAYVLGIETGDMSFESTCEEFDDDDSCDELLSLMSKLDEEMVNIISRKDYLSIINWFGDTKTISSHLCALTTHEVFHQGQIVAFYYVLGRKIPEKVAEDWALPQISSQNRE